MESQPQNPEFRINSENFHPCTYEKANNKGTFHKQQSGFLKLTSI